MYVDAMGKHILYLEQYLNDSRETQLFTSMKDLWLGIM